MTAPSYALTALASPATPWEVAVVDGPRLITRSHSDADLVHAAFLILRTREMTGHLILGDVVDLAEALMHLRADFSMQAAPVSASEGYHLVLEGKMDEVSHRCRGDYGVSLDRASEDTEFWVVYDIHPDSDNKPRVFADEAPARIEFRIRVRRLEGALGKLDSCSDPELASARETDAAPDMQEGIE